MKFLMLSPEEQLIRRRAVLGAAILLVGIVYPILSAQRANAATALTQVLVRFDRMVINTQTTGTVCAKPNAAGVESSLTVTFPTNYVLGTAANFTVSTTNLAWPATATAWLGINTASNVTGQVVTFPSTDLVAGTLYCFNWINTAAVKTPTSASGSDLVGSLATNIDATAANFATAALDGTTKFDQITVSATINTTFNFSLSGNTDNLGAITTGSVSASPTPRIARVDTNAKNGWLVWGQDSNTGLKSAAAANYIIDTLPVATNTTITAGSDGYVTGVTSTQASGTGTITVAAPFVGGSLGKGAMFDTSLRQIATSSGTASNAALTLTNYAAIATTTPAATDYTDLQTYVAAGLF